MMKRLIQAATVAALGVAAAVPANAAVVLNFTPGAPSPSAGFTVINTFNSLAGITTTGTVQIKTPPSDGNGAPPANSVPAGTPYLSVLAGSSATISLPSAQAFQFDWGSIDRYNRLRIFGSVANSDAVAKVGPLDW